MNLKLRKLTFDEFLGLSIIVGCILILTIGVLDAINYFN